MIYRERTAAYRGGMARLSGLGATSPSTGQNCPAGGDWDQWCDCAFPPTRTDPLTNGKCRAWRPGAPWTVVGAMLRGIPQTGSGSGGVSTIFSTVSNLLAPAAPPSAPVAAPEDAILGIPTTVAAVGAGVLVLGVGAYLMSRGKGRKRSLAGYRRRRSTRRR